MSEPQDRSTPDGLFDAGAQAERTALAWQRTGLSAIAVGALLVHTHPERYALSLLPGVLLMMSGTLSAAVFAPLRYRRIVRAVRARHSPAEPRTILLFCVLVSLVVVTAGLSVFLG